MKRILCACSLTCCLPHNSLLLLYTIRSKISGICINDDDFALRIATSCVNMPLGCLWDEVISFTDVWWCEELNSTAQSRMNMESAFCSAKRTLWIRHLLMLQVTNLFMVPKLINYLVIICRFLAIKMAVVYHVYKSFMLLKLLILHYYQILSFMTSSNKGFSQEVR